MTARPEDTGTKTISNATPREGDPPITTKLVEEHGLSAAEYARILDILGREPTFTELGVFSAMWSEHCGYKNSKRLLRLLPTTAPWVIQGPGENAGVIDIGGGLALAFKIESHKQQIRSLQKKLINYRNFPRIVADGSWKMKQMRV